MKLPVSKRPVKYLTWDEACEESSRLSKLQEVRKLTIEEEHRKYDCITRMHHPLPFFKKNDHCFGKRKPKVVG